ncbi:hypothetical protein, partial [Enterococcus faecium]|uniref:hypothetical protein n=1 Tax=Enterococcus faecium TaxID=1352 RepID=UPI001CD552DA
QRSNGFGLTAGRNDEILTRWNLEKILTNRVRGIDSNPGFQIIVDKLCIGILDTVIKYFS